MNFLYRHAFKLLAVAILLYAAITAMIWNQLANITG